VCCGLVGEVQHASVSSVWNGSTNRFNTCIDIYSYGTQLQNEMGRNLDERLAGYGPDTLQQVFSSTKNLTAIAVAIFVDRGLLAYEEKVSAYWPGEQRERSICSSRDAVWLFLYVLRVCTAREARHHGG
jgi:CubicO group peptidase (beta-lactamase class C family)